jgi:hypothetical protein
VYLLVNAMLVAFWLARGRAPGDAADGIGGRRAGVGAATQSSSSYGRK